MNKPTDRQVDILSHALAWPDCNRNYFNADEDSDDYSDCEELVQSGLMSRFNPYWVPGYIYRVTKEGKEVLTNG